MQKKIKVMSLIWSMGAGGAQQVLINYLRDFQSDPDIDFGVYVYTEPTDSKYDKEIREKNYNVVYLNNPKTRINIPYIKGFFQKSISRLAWQEAIHNYKPDIVHVHISELLCDTLHGIESENIPIRFDTLHSCPYRYVGKKRKFISEAFQKKKVIPVCLTEEQVRQATEWYGINKYELVRNGIDIKEIKEKCCYKDEERKLLGIGNDTVMVLGVGRLNPVKNFTLLIHIFAELNKRQKQSVLVIAGDGKEKKKLIWLAKKLGIEEKVHFLGNVKNVVPLYCAADVLAVTSISESASLVALEAQLCGLRCVLSDGVPKESIISNNSKKMKKDAGISEWVDALMDKDYVGTAILSNEDYEVHNISKKMKEIYLRYYNEYRNNIVDSE